MKNQLTIKAFAEWCEKQPADKQYAYTDSNICACGQYAQTLGISRRQWTDSKYSNGRNFWAKADNAASDWPWTFGGLASRLRAS